MHCRLCISIVILVSVFVAPLALGEERTDYYEGTKIYQIYPKTIQHLKTLQKFDEKNGLFFWAKLFSINSSIDVMVKPEDQENFSSLLKVHNIDYDVVVENVHNTTFVEHHQKAITKIPLGTINFKQYHRFKVIREYLRTLAKNYSNIVRLKSIGRSLEGRGIFLLKVSSNHSTSKKSPIANQSNPIILIDAGIHAREWISPAVTLYFIHELVENPKNKRLFEKVDWHFIPVMNPDGYEYTFTKQRMWRKTRRPGKECDGVDANRNFDFFWQEGDSEECSPVYRGSEPFSEPESEALRSYMLGHKNIKLYLSLHSDAQAILYPWGTIPDLPIDVEELHALGEKVAKAIKLKNGTQYKVGSVHNILYSLYGSSTDWAKGVCGINLTYTVELPSGGDEGFDMPPGNIERVGMETWEGLKVWYDYVRDKFVVKNKK